MMLIEAKRIFGTNIDFIKYAIYSSRLSVYNRNRCRNYIKGNFGYKLYYQNHLSVHNLAVDGFKFFTRIDVSAIGIFTIQVDIFVESF